MKASFAKVVSKAILVAGGLVSGGLNFVSMKPMANRLKNELSKPVNYSKAETSQDLEQIGHERFARESKDTDLVHSVISENVSEK